MERIITDELSKRLSFRDGLLWFSNPAAKVIDKFYGSFKPYQKPTIIYLVVAY
jgi:hypothetical protein